MMTPERLARALTEALGDRVKTVVLFGSAAAGDHAGRWSDYNVLAVIEPLGIPELTVLARAMRGWVRAGNPPPLLFTPRELSGSGDAFPMELTDLKASYRVLAGEDLIQGLRVPVEHLRAELEHELRGKLLQLRQQYCLAGGDRRQLTRLLIRSLSTFLVLGRGVLRLLWQGEVPVNKLEAARALAGHLSLRADIFETIDRLKRGRSVPRGLDVEQLFTDYLQTIESIVRALDQGAP